jgi:4'-phosphopantetheinyl transferase
MIALRPSEVHVWIVDFAGVSVADLLHDISPDERREAAAFAIESRRDDFIRSRAALRRLLSGYVQTPPADIGITRSATGKPALATKTGLHFNLSHSGPHTLIALARDGRVGVDVQVVRHDARCLDLARRFFHPQEYQRLQGVPAAELPSAFFDLWTLKEAWHKGTGAGIAGGLDRMIDADADPPRIAASPHHSDADTWQLRRLSIAKDTRAAIAVEGNAAFQTRLARWNLLHEPCHEAVRETAP